jgi:hypothetical protein
MAPRKSNVSAVSNEDAGTKAAAKEAREDSLSVEVCAYSAVATHIRLMFAGPQPPQIDSPAPSKRRPPPEHADTKRCTPRHVEKRNRFRQLPHIMVRALPNDPAPHNLIVERSAAEHAARSGKKTVMPKDVFDAMHELEFEFMLPRLEAEVNKFTSIQADKRNTYRKKVREEKKAVVAPKDIAANGTGGEDESPPMKKARRESGDVGEASEEEEGVDETIDDVVEDDEVEDDEVEEEVQDEGLTEDPLEERENEASDDEMADGDESD